MKSKNLLKEQKGITLVALVVTIVVLLILAGVTITYVFSDNGILSQAQTAANKTDTTTMLEEIQSKLLARQLANTDTWTYSNTDVIEVIEEVASVTVDEWDDEFYTENGNKVIISSLWVGNAPISTKNSYVGYYADVNGDDTVDGVIFVDLMFAAENSPWGSNGWGEYSWEVLTDGVKSYYVSQESYTADFGTMAVISPVSGTTGEERFYVMALEDVDSSYHYWYYCAYSYGMSDYKTATSGDFGAGYKNTGTMIDYWNTSYYGTQNGSTKYTDMWGLSDLQTAYVNGWFVPSEEEWSAFAGELRITKSNYSDYRSKH